MNTIIYNNRNFEMSGLTEINFKFNHELLINEVKYWRDRVPELQGDKSPFPKEYYKVIKDMKQISEDARYPEIQLPVACEETERFLRHYSLTNVDVRPRYYVLKQDGFLGPHIDLATQCSINTVLTDPNTPIYLGGRSYDVHHDEEIEEAKEIVKVIGDDIKAHLTPYKYKTAALDTTRIHAVDNKGHNERLLFKLSFFDITYYELIREIHE